MVVLEGWTISWGILQAYLLTPEQYIQATRHPWLANSLFVGGTFTICGTLAVSPLFLFRAETPSRNGLTGH